MPSTAVPFLLGFRSRC